MKRIIITICIMFISIYARADQLAWLTKEQAEKTTSFLKNNGITEAILWCACCSDEPKIKLKINRYFYQYAGTLEGIKYYEVVLVGRLDDGKQFSKPVDLAYVFLRVGRQAKCFGKLLNFECDPCTLPFDWKFPNNKYPNQVLRDTTAFFFTPNRVNSDTIKRRIF